VTIEAGADVDDTTEEELRVEAAVEGGTDDDTD